MAIPEIMKPRIFREPSMNAVIEMLSKEWPLGAKAIYSKINAEHNITYAALYKRLNQLSQLNILNKSGGKFELSREWIQDVHDFSAFMLSKRSSKSSSPEEILEMGEDAKLLVFPNILELDAWFLKMTALAERRLPKELVIPMHYKHNWWPLIHTHEEDAATKEHRERYYFLCAGNTAVDNWCCELERRLGFNILWGVHCAETYDVMVFGDLLFQVFIPNETMKRIKDMYTRVKGIEEFDVSKLLKLFSEKRNVNVMAMRNSTAAEDIRTRTIEMFRNRGRRKYSEANK